MIKSFQAHLTKYILEFNPISVLLPVSVGHIYQRLFSALVSIVSMSNMFTGDTVPKPKQDLSLASTLHYPPEQYISRDRL